MHSNSDGRGILIVDDDDNVRRLLSALLISEGYHVVEAGNGLEALHKLKQRHVDLVISDYRMPGFDGLQLLAVCRIVWPDIAVIITSGDSSDWSERAMSEGAQAWVAKPWERTCLIDTVRQAIETMSGLSCLQPVQPQ